jgi:hypothetical protein
MDDASAPVTRRQPARSGWRGPAQPRRLLCSDRACPISPACNPDESSTGHMTCSTTGVRTAEGAVVDHPLQTSM